MSPSESIQPPIDSPEHDPAVHYEGTLPYGWCTCGWEGPTRDREREAADDVRAHRRESDA